MTDILLNLSNHPYTNWDERQRKAATYYGTVVDMTFPAVDESADESYIKLLAEEYLQEVQLVGTPDAVCVHLMGEMTFCFALLKLLQKAGYTCVASTSHRIVADGVAGQKQVTFHFERFRIYG